MKIAITVITYNRPNSLRRLMESLLRADYHGYEVDLILSVDRSNCQELYDYADRLQWPYGRLIREYKPENMGLRAHILSCGTYFEKYGQDALVVLEDDIYVARDFWNYVVETTGRYSQDPRIAGISLYAMGRSLHRDVPFVPLRGRYDAYFMQYAQSWGQIWMREQWQAFARWYEQNQDYCFDTPRLPCNVTRWPKTSWLRYHIAYCVENNKYFVYPYESLTTNFADQGVHYKSDTDKMQVRLLWGEKDGYRLPDPDSPDSLFYDVFGENQRLFEALELPAEELCVDIYCLCDNPDKRRYWLTVRQLPYRVVRSFGMTVKPQDMNVLEKIPGDMIWLYDTTQPAEPPRVKAGQRDMQLWDYYYDSPNVVKYNVPYIYCTQMWQRIAMVFRAKLKKWRSKR